MTARRLGRLEISIDGARVVLAGRLDDASPISELASELPPGDVAIDTGGVTFVTSIGMREWLRLLRALGARGTVTLERVGVVLITHMNLLPELAGVRITSFHAHYACDGCGAEATLVVDAVAHAAELRQMRVPRLPCPECGVPMELGDFPERYLTIFRG